MKIVLPRTLAEPLTIGWPEPYDHGVFPGLVIDELTESFRTLEAAKMLPSADRNRMSISIQEVCDHLKEIAEVWGMEGIFTTCANIHLDATMVGYIFTVVFSEPGKNKRHYVQFKTYF